MKVKDIRLTLLRVMMCGFVLLSAMATAQAQFKAGIQGTVKDSSGGLVPEAKVTLTSKETGKTQEATASDEGFYRLSGLAPGRYTITVERTGYKKTVLENVEVSAETVQGLDIALEAGEVSATVTITQETVQLLETENANVDKTITNEEILRLPQAGRDPYELARLTPGVFGTGARGANGNSVGLPNTSGPGGSNNSKLAAHFPLQKSSCLILPVLTYWEDLPSCHSLLWRQYQKRLASNAPVHMDRVPIAATVRSPR